MSETTLRCYYEVLNVDRKATYDEIRVAYKKMALACHPDKNHGNAEVAAAKFKELQNAYTVLSDDQERAWYDSHRESILRGDSEGNSAPDELNLFKYFSARCYNGFEESLKENFFEVYHHVFDTLIEEESFYDDRAKTWPRFGDSQMEYAEVSKFYTHWRNFSTYKTFAWKDEYKVNELEERYQRRYAERINQKERSTAKKEYLQNVISLAHFVYRRDPRVTAFQEAQAKAAEEKQLQRDLREAEAARRRREANEKVWAEAAAKELEEEREREARGEAMDGTFLDMMYEKQRQMQEVMKNKGHGWAGEDKINEFAMLSADVDERHDKKKESFNCLACKKSFTSAATLKEHMNSTKHKAKLKKLAANGVDVEELMNSAVAGSASPEEECANGDGSGTLGTGVTVAEHDKTEKDEEEEGNINATFNARSKKANKKMAAVSETQALARAQQEAPPVNDESNDDSLPSTMANKRRKKKDKNRRLQQMPQENRDNMNRKEMDDSESEQELPTRTSNAFGAFNRRR